MKNVRKAVVLLVAILAIFAFTRSVNAAAISTNKTANNTSNSVNNTTNSVKNETDEPTNTVANTVQNTVQNTYQPIGTSNAAENIPHAGIEDSYFNFALILLLTLVLGMFSLIQYNKIIKKDQEN